jgi:ATP-binding cassette, subfamily C (CFTR/MRP), member 1
MGELVAAQSPLTGSAEQNWSLNASSSITPYFQYLSSKAEPLCGDPEGWGPVSVNRYDLTPCFLDIWIVLVAVWGILFGAGATWYLLKKRHAQEVPKNWHFHAKL